MKPLRVLASAVVAVAFVCAPLTARAQVLQAVPSDAYVVIKFNKIKATSEKLAALSQKLGLAQLQPGFADPLGEFKRTSNLSKGVDDAGDAAVVIPAMPDGANKQRGEPPMIVLVPVTDYAAFLTNFPNAKPADASGVTVTKIAQDPNDSYIVNWGKYAAIGNTKEMVSKKPDGIKPSPLAAKELESKDICAFVNMKSARAKILPELTKGRAKFLAEFEKNLKKQQGAASPRAGAAGAPGAAGGAAAADPQKAAAAAAQQKFAPLAKSLVNRAIDVVEQVVTDADAATYGWSLSADGIVPSAVLEFAKESPSAKRVAECKNSGDPVLAGLPAGKYMFYGGTAGGDPKVGQKLINDFLAPIEKDLAALGSDGKPITDYLTALKSYAASLKGQSFGMLTPQGMLGQEAIFQVLTVQRGNADAIMAAARKMSESQEALMAMFAGPGAPQMNMKTTYTAKAKTVDGVALDQMQTSFAPPAGARATPQQMQMQQMMTWMYGPGGMTAYLGKVGSPGTELEFAL